MRALLSSAALSPFLLTFLPPEAWDCFPQSMGTLFCFFFSGSLFLFFFFSATFISSIQLTKLMFSPLSASLPLMHPRTDSVLLSSGPSVLNVLHLCSNEQSFPTGLLSPRFSRDGCVHAWRDGHSRTEVLHLPQLLLYTSVWVHVQEHRAAPALPAAVLFLLLPVSPPCTRGQVTGTCVPAVLHTWALL